MKSECCGNCNHSSKSVTVPKLYCHLTDELVELGNVRELVSKIQSQRKEAGFEVADHIHIFVKADSKFEAFALKYKAEIMQDTLADTLEVGKTDGFVKENDINGENVVVGLKKVQ